MAMSSTTCALDGSRRLPSMSKLMTDAAAPEPDAIDELIIEASLSVAFRVLAADALAPAPGEYRSTPTRSSLMARYEKVSSFSIASSFFTRIENTRRGSASIEN